MKYEKYSTLKSASKVVFKKQAEVTEVLESDRNVTTPFQEEYVYLEEKKYNPDTGAEETIVKTTMDASQLEAEKTRLTRHKDELEANIAQLGKMITDIKAL